MTVLISSLKHSNRRLRLGIILASMLCCLFTNAQQWELLDSQALELPVQKISADRLHNIYINDSKGNIHKLDSLGHPLALYAPTQFGNLTTMESWASFRVFLFYEDTQRFVFLDRYLAASDFYEFPIDQFGFVKLAAPSSDNQIWLLDLRSLNLSKFDFTFNDITLNQSLNQLSDTLNFNPHQLMEYQNRVYLGDSKMGVLVFDNLGNYLRTLAKPELSQFHLQGEQLYYLKGHQLFLFSIYSDQEQVIELPATGLTYQHVLKLGKTTILISNTKIYFYQYKIL